MASETAKAVANINAWQQDGRVHPLTCGNNSSHRPLVAEDRNGSVLLVCADCDYTQAFIPACVQVPR